MHSSNGTKSLKLSASSWNFGLTCTVHCEYMWPKVRKEILTEVTKDPTVIKFISRWRKD